MALAGSIAGGVAGVLGNPAELIMVRMQADKAKPPESELDAFFLSQSSLTHRAVQLPELGTRPVPHDPRGGVQIVGTGRGPERDQSDLDEHVPAREVSRRACVLRDGLIRSYDWFKEELIRNKLMTDGPALHFVASVGAVS
jgi:dicarboxylate transporter 10